jgi:hypothetical protein
MTDAQHAELIAIVMLASSTNALASALQVPVDERFDVAATPAAPEAASNRTFAPRRRAPRRTRRG